MAVTTEVIPQNSIPVLDHGFVRLDAAMADDLSVVNAARVSFARRKDVMEEADEGLIRFLMRDRHGTPFEHNAFRFHIRAPIFVAREWFRLTGEDRILTTAPFFHITGLGLHLALALANGIPMVLTYRFEPATVLGLMDRYRPTFTVGTPKP